MKIAIRKEPNGPIYIDKEICSKMIRYKDNETKEIKTERMFSDETLSKPPYYYTIIEIDDIYEDCQPIDFNDDLTLNIEKYNARKLAEENGIKLPIMLKELEELTKDMAQVDAGLVVPNIEDKKARFRELLNKVREIQGKEQRQILNEQ